jgi:hypothetical protein
VDGGSNEAGGDDQTLDRPSSKEARSKKKHDRCGRKVDDGSNEDDGRPSAYVAAPDDDASPHCEGNNLFFSPMWVARVTTRRILLVLVL